MKKIFLYSYQFTQRNKVQTYKTFVIVRDRDFPHQPSEKEWLDKANEKFIQKFPFVYSVKGVEFTDDIIDYVEVR